MRQRILCITSNGEEVIFGTIEWDGDKAEITDERDEESFRIDADAVLEVTDAPDEDDEPWDGFRNDVEADADALASAGWGTDEDYGSAADML